MGGISFEKAMEAAKANAKVARKDWNRDPASNGGGTISVSFVPGMGIKSKPYYALTTSSGKFVPGWVPTQNDMLAEDWFVVTADKEAVDPNEETREIKAL